MLIRRLLNEGDAGGGGDGTPPAGGDGTPPAGKQGGMGGGADGSLDEHTFGGNEAWKNALGDMAKDPALANYLDVDDQGEFMQKVTRGFLSAQQMVGNNVKIPGRDSTDEERSAFFDKLGRPKEADGYKLPTENMPDGVEISKEIFAQYAPEMHRLGITEQQAAGLVRAHANVVAGMQQQQTENWNKAVANVESTLKNEWGTAYDQNRELANRAIELGGEELAARIRDSELVNDPEFLNLMARIGREHAEDEVVGGGGNQSFKRTSSEAEQALNDLDAKIASDPDLQQALSDPLHEKHAELNALYEKLSDDAYGTKPVGQDDVLVG